MDSGCGQRQPPAARSAWTLSQSPDQPAGTEERSGSLAPAGALISLQTVLGDSGVWNNYTDWVTAVVPLSRRILHRPSDGLKRPPARSYPRPARISVGIWPEGDRLAADTTYRRATPEAALLHWVYLSNSPRSRMSAPPLDLDLDALDLRRLKRLSQAMRLEVPLQVWRARVGSQGESQPMAGH